ncbi:P-loop ATPase, Sll1717 family [Streptomyces sp. NPDC055059]
MGMEQDFRRFNFGFADSITEYKEAPTLLRDGYYDLERIEERVVNSHEFILLGYKGSGKSAVGARLRLRSQASPGLYSVPSPILVDELPLGQFKDVVPPAMGAEMKHRDAWMLHLLIQVSLTLAGDGQGDPDSKKKITALVDAMKKNGVTPRRPTTLKWFRANKVKATVGVAGVANIGAEFERRQTEAGTLGDWIEYLRKTTREFRSGRKHYIFIDGLDDLSLIKEGRSELLGGLIRAVTDLNRDYSEHSAPIKLVVCCRTDIYEKISLPHRGKIRRDYALELNWYQDPRDYKASHLVRLANMRAQLVDEGCKDIFNRFFPPKLYDEPSTKWLLMQTRHTPRDLLQLLKIIQKFVSGPGMVPEDKVKAGVAEYSRIYLMDEMRDALHAYFKDSELSRIVDLLGALHRRNFTFDKVQEIVDSDPRFKGNVDPYKALESLFDTSFIGNVAGGHFFFKYRNPEASLSFNEVMQLHLGLWKALNVPYKRTSGPIS